MKKNFSFVYQMKRKAVRDLKIVTETLGNLHVTGTATINPGSVLDDLLDRYTIDLDYVFYNGENILPVLDWRENRTEIEEAAAAHVHNEIMNQLLAA